MPKAQTSILLTLATLIFLAWSFLFHQHRQMIDGPMSTMWMPPSKTSEWSLLDFGTVFVMWSVMMIAMMLPSAVPMLMVFAKICRQRNYSPYLSAMAFLLGYLIIWFCFSIALTLLQWQMHGLLWLSPMMGNNNRVLAIAIFLMAAAYQLLPLKNACLKYCQSPVGFLMNHWQNRPFGALSMGSHHGLICLGCCWAEMLLMFSIGVMNLTGMILLTLLIALEKLSPLEAHITSRTGAIIFLAWAAFLLISGHSG